MLNQTTLSIIFAVLLYALACDDGSTSADTQGIGDGQGKSNETLDIGDEQGVTIGLENTYQTDVDVSCNIASPVSYVASDGVLELITVTLSGVIRAYDASNGAERWRLTIDAPEEQSPIFVATPLVLDDLLVLTWQNALIREGLPDQGAAWPKVSHHTQVLDLTTHQWHPDYPRVQLAATKTAWDGSTIMFDSSKHLSRCEVVHLEPKDGRDLVYVALGVGGGGHPYYGWMFEFDLDAWRTGGVNAAISSVLLTSTDTDCSFNNEDVLVSEVCGAGIWSPAGPLKTTDLQGNPKLLVPTGNGRIDLKQLAYSHGLLRVGPGLEFDPGCDPELCANFNESDPSIDCLASCDHYFVPRLKPGQTFQPENGRCDGESFIECYGTLDADFGSSTPVEITLPSGRRVLVHPAKDGAIYLIDREHLGTMLDRLQAIEPCGTETDRCGAIWAGQFVTQPVVYEKDGEILVITSGFAFDQTHPAGVVAVRVVDGESPRLELAWTAPDFSTPDAIESFRRHTGRPVMHTIGGESYVFVVEPASPGRLWVIRAKDGVIMARKALQSWGARYSKPIIHNNTITIGTCSDFAGLADGQLEALDFFLTRDGEPFDPGTTPDITGESCERGGSPCGDNEYCERSSCGGPGACLPKPTECDESGPQVCDCDGNAYTNVCQAHRDGVYIDLDGACN